MLFKKIICSLAICGTIQCANASVGSALTSYYNNLNSNAKIERTAVTTNGVTVGGYYQRSPNVDLTIGYVTPPTIKGGCGNIDFNMGAFSFISGDQIVQAMQAIGRDAKGLLFMEGIEIVSSMFAGDLKTFLDQVNKWLGVLKNSCQASQMLVGGLNETVGKPFGLCQNANRFNNTLSDENTIQQNCQAASQGMSDIKSIFSKDPDTLSDSQKQAQIALAVDIASQGGLLQNLLAGYFASTGKIDGLSSDLGNLVLATTGDVYIPPFNSDASASTGMANPIAVERALSMEKVMQITLENYSDMKASEMLTMTNCDFAYNDKTHRATTPCSVSSSNKAYKTDKANSIFDLYATIQNQLTSLENSINNPNSSGGITNTQLQLISMVDAPIYQVLQLSNDLGRSEEGHKLVTDYMNYTIHRIYATLFSSITTATQNEIAYLELSQSYSNTYKIINDNLKANQDIIKTQLQKDLTVNGKNLDLMEVRDKLNTLKKELELETSPALLSQLSFSSTQLTGGGK